MTENMKAFLAKVSGDEELSKKVSQETDVKALIALAAQLGVALTEDDLRKEPQELDDDDLDNVAGGESVNCSCVVGGGGSGDDNDKTCACVLAGVGLCKDGSERCFCPVAGFGYQY